ncbi:MAG: hypothetical protein HOV81_29295 [Kofleriaceae bacterium]|nr:hypothetical protein [Kofleriaceae bacterium]
MPPITFVRDTPPAPPPNGNGMLGRPTGCGAGAVGATGAPHDWQGTVCVECAQALAPQRPQRDGWYEGWFMPW